MTNDISFTRGPARRPLPAASHDALLQWSTGLVTTTRSLYTGWLVERGRNEVLDTAMQRAGFDTVIIKHGNGNIVTYWALEQATVFVLADGVQTIAEMGHTNERFGIAFGWRVLPDGRRQSILKCRVLLRELLEVGYSAPLTLSIKGTITSDLINGLTRHYEVLDAIDALRHEQGKAPLNPPFYACSLAIVPGEEVMRGSAQQKAIIPPLVAIPEQIRRDYLVEHYIRTEWVPIVERLMDATIHWSVTTSAQIAHEPSHKHYQEA
jgi:hypothetical protein